LIRLFVLSFFAAAAAFAQDHSVQYVTQPFHPDVTVNPLATAGVATLPLWSATDGGYTYQMVGVNPMISGNNLTTTVVANVVPVIVKFADGTTFDPTVKSSCVTQAPTSLVASSPIFNNIAYAPGGTNVGTSQYLDNYQRANFWKYTSATGINPNYHILLSASPAAAVTLTVPSASGSTVAAPCVRMGQIDLNYFDKWAQATIPTLGGQGVLPSTVPVLLMSNVVLTTSALNGCCVLGYHSAFNNPNYSSALQTYAMADFDTTGNFSGTQDIAPLSHEIVEWLDDPTALNQTPAWGHTGQVTGCQTNLEPADPLTGYTYTVTMSNAYTYHLQELAFLSWFYRDNPSIGVNGWYSSLGTFQTPSTPCYTTSTTLSISPATLTLGQPATIGITVGGSGSGLSPTGTVTLTTSLSTTPIATYTLSGGSVSTSTTALPAGTYTVTAKYSGDANFGSSTSNTVSVTVSSSTAPTVTLSPSALTFASTTVGTTSAAQTVSLKNTGTASLTISSVSISGTNAADFSQTNNCGGSVAAGATCVMSIAFKPAATGTRTATLAVADNATGSPQKVTLVGTGTAAPAPVVTLSPTSISFPNTTVGVASAAVAVTLKNTGSATLAIASISISGKNPADFSQTNACGTSLSAAASCTISVTFKPTASGSRTASLSVADNATGSPQSVALTGSGTAKAVTVKAVTRRRG
jgi:hypothetical protein